MTAFLDKTVFFGNNHKTVFSGNKLMTKLTKTLNYADPHTSDFESAANVDFSRFPVSAVSVINNPVLKPRSNTAFFNNSVFYQ